jgi:hypothetical protein
MYNISLIMGPCQVGIETDEKLSFDALDTLLNRGSLTVLTLFNAHMGAMVKYENYDNDSDCEECSSIKEELD